MSQKTNLFTKQDPMRRVLISLIPIFLWSLYLYGWRVLAIGAVVFAVGILTEFIFEKSRNKKVSEAVLVTSALLTLSFPPGVQLWVAAVASVFAVLFGKEVFGGFGRNVYNPAITGRTFTYISFPLLMQTTWMIPGNFGLTAMNRQVQGSVWLEGLFMILLCALLFYLIWKSDGNTKTVKIAVPVAVGLTVIFYVLTAYGGLRGDLVNQILVPPPAPWSDVDVMATATPIEIYKGLAQQNNWHQGVSLFGINMGDMAANNPINLFLGLRIGSIGEGAIFLILLAGFYLLITKTANWRPMMWTVVSALGLTAIFYYSGIMAGRFPLLNLKPDFLGQILDIAGFAMSGALLFGAVFMATDPVSAPKKAIPQHLYGIIIGSLTIVIRVFAGFPEGISFAILTANTFASLLDEPFSGKKKSEKPEIEKTTSQGAN